MLKRRYKRMTAWMLTLAVLFAAVQCMTFTAFAEEITVFSGGSGTENDPYLISTKEDLFALAEAINADTEGKLDAADSCGLGGYHGYYFKQTNNIDLTGVAWAPFNFCGVYDGNGFEIQNLSVSEKRFDSTEAGTGEVTENEYEAAFFGQLVHAVIKNLTFTDCSATIAATLEPDAGRDIYVAIVASTAIAARLENVKTKNCTVVQNAEPGNLAYAGGLIGYADICNITDCSVNGGSITVGGNADRSSSAGGIVGGVGDGFYEYKDYYNMVIGAGEPFGIFGCTVTADISVNNGASGNAGGIVGWTVVDYITHTIENCYVEADITAGRATGICGYSSSKDSVNSCFANIGTFTGNTRHTIGSDGTFTNCVFRADDATGVDGTKDTLYSEDQFADGTVLNVLGDAWTQNIGVDAYPVLVTTNMVTFAANGGTGTMDAVKVDDGSEYTLPANGFTAPENKQFKGWSFATDGEVIDTEKITVNEDIILYAIWETSGSDSDSEQKPDLPLIIPGSDNDTNIMMPEKESQLENVMELYQMQILTDNSGFTDISASDWFRSDVMSLVSEGIINGYPDGSFIPQGKVTWGEALKMVLLATRYGEQAPTGDHWASGYMELAIELGIIPGEVDLNAYITRGEMADLVKAAMKLGNADIANPFDEVAPASAVALYEAGIIKGSADNGKLLFRAESTITRAEISAIIWRVYCAH